MLGVLLGIMLVIYIVKLLFVNPLRYIFSSFDEKTPVPRSPRRDIPTRKPSLPPKPVTCDYDPEHELSYPFTD